MKDNIVIEGMCFRDEAQKAMTQYMLSNSEPIDNEELMEFFVKRKYPREIWDRIAFHMSFGGSVVFDSDVTLDAFNDRHERSPVLFVYHKTNTQEDITSE